MIIFALFVFVGLIKSAVGQLNASTLLTAEGWDPASSMTTILETCLALRDDSLDKAEALKEEAYRAKDEAYAIREKGLEARSALETTLVETLDLIKTQAISTNLNLQEIKTSLSSMAARLDTLEQRLEEMEEREEKLEIGGGELIPAARVAQSTTLRQSGLPESHWAPEKAIDGNLGTYSHTVCNHHPHWFRYYFSGKRSVGRIKLVNGKLDQRKTRLNGAVVSVMVNDEGHRATCRLNTINVREGDSFQAQTYYLDCTGNSGIGVEVLLDRAGTCLEIRDIAVYAP